MCIYRIYYILLSIFNLNVQLHICDWLNNFTKLQKILRYKRINSTDKYMFQVNNQNSKARRKTSRK